LFESNQPDEPDRPYTKRMALSPFFTDQAAFVRALTQSIEDIEK
jgi:hypothetical protein